MKLVEIHIILIYKSTRDSFPYFLFFIYKINIILVTHHSVPVPSVTLVIVVGGRCSADGYIASVNEYLIQIPVVVDEVVTIGIAAI